MNPYKPPQSNTKPTNLGTPSIIAKVYCLVGLSFIFFALDSLTCSTVLDAGWRNPMNYLFIIIWGGILFWVMLSISKRRGNPKYTFLLLAFVVFAGAIVFPMGCYSIYFGVGEAGCFLLAYYSLNKPSASAWFESSVE
ncbi:hypothetical protein [Ostreibacterium oceani]|uniref:Uncharacterized protein n=1 Tax=Ostreibacterium oceani TaxID=2654998 RepID=A0A6N7EYR3_9GAMM|nr:hypothetical protein [Ostreibacterium oceani]MPV86519.1 hypothetical protein [Ostreibacterium oceani]